MSFSVSGLPVFVCEYLGRPVRMQRGGVVRMPAGGDRFSWTFSGTRNQLTVTGRTAAQARQNVADKIARLDGRQDRRRRGG